MPVPLRQLTLEGARDHISARCLEAASPDLVGLESEWLSVASEDHARAVPLDALERVARGAPPMPCASALTFEPGGQVELSGPPVADIGAGCTGMATDLAALDEALASEGLHTLGAGIDPERPPQRVVSGPRYAAMEAYFDGDGPAGRTMMCSTASIQVNVGLGDEPDRRWRLAHDLGPTLVACFANSAVAEGRRTGWKSTRLANWWSIDRSRTAPVGGPSREFVPYALDARVMLVRRDPATYVPLHRPLCFAAWIEDGHELGFPSVDDLDYHLTTLFPPVRPRGWLELRYLDALPHPWWRVAATVAATLLTDLEAGDRAARGAAGTEGLWLEAARVGLGHPGLARSAASGFAAALDALPRVGADASSSAAVAAFADRYVARRRCPADDVSDELLAQGASA